MSAQNAQIKFEQKALRISMYGGVIFVVLEVLMALLTHSQAVLMDAAYDAAELVLIAISLRIVPLLYKPYTEKRPFGYGQVESLFIVFKGLLLVAVTAGLIVNNAIILFQGGHHVSFTFVSLFELYAALQGGIIMVILKRMNRKLDSPMVEVEINGWYIDMVASIGMSAAFILPVVVKTGWMAVFAPYLDSTVAIFLSLFILPIPVKTIKTGMRDLFLIAPEQETVDKIKSISGEILSGENFFDRFSDISYEILRTGRRLWVSIYVTPKKDSITISRWSELQGEIEKALIDEFGDVDVELLPDIK